MKFFSEELRAVEPPGGNMKTRPDPALNNCCKQLRSTSLVVAMGEKDGATGGGN